MAAGGGPPRTVRLRWPRHYRVIASRWPPLALFEDHCPPHLMAALWALEARTNPRLQQQTGDLTLVAPEDRVSGPGASVVMAAFTHIGFPSRFSDGGWGLYYAGRELETAVRETVFHRERLARAAALGPDEWGMRAWIGKPARPLHDLRPAAYRPLHAPDDYTQSQAFAAGLRRAGSWGLVYHSVRHPGGQCLAALRPPAVTLPVQGQNLAYRWDGRRVTQVYERSEPLFDFGCYYSDRP